MNMPNAGSRMFRQREDFIVIPHEIIQSEIFLWSKPYCGKRYTVELLVQPYAVLFATYNNFLQKWSKRH
jgi:hypothetical protein